MGPCGSDKDCKLDRICDAGQCVWAQGGVPLGAPGPRPAPPVPVRPGQKAASPLPLPQYAIEPAQAMFRFGPAHRGRSPYVLPSARPSVWWTFSTGGPVTSSPAIAEDGALLFGSHDGKLYAISRDGSIKWQHATGDIIFSSPAVTHDGTIYIGSDDDHLYAIGPKSDKPRWVFQVGSCPQRVGVGPEASRCDVDAGPTIGPDGVIYTGGDGIYAINPDGTLRWRFATNGHVASAPALLADGTVVAGSQDDLIYAIAPVDSSAGTSAPAATSTRAPASATTGRSTSAATITSCTRSTPTARCAGPSTPAAICARRRRSATAWCTSAPSTPSCTPSAPTGRCTGRSAPATASSRRRWSIPRGPSLFGSQDDRVYALEPDGRLRWSVELGGDVDSSPILAADGTIFVGADDRKLYALRAGISASR